VLSCPVEARLVERQLRLAGHFQSLLDVKSKFDNIARLHDIITAFGAHLAGRFGSLLATSGYEVVKIYYLSGDKSALKITMNNSGSLGRSSAFFYCPGSNFLWASS